MNGYWIDALGTKHRYFTDVVGSTALNQEVGDERMNEIHKGREIKTIGDAFMAAFHSVDEALDFALALQGNSGHRRIEVRAGIHLGTMQVEGSDVFGSTVNFAARVVGAIKDAEIWLSDRAKTDLGDLRAMRFAGLAWKCQDGLTMKGFVGTFTLWAPDQ